MRAHFGLPSVRNGRLRKSVWLIWYSLYLLPPNRADEVDKRAPISVKFEIPYFTVSGIQVRYLKVVEKAGYSSLPWVRYITQNGDDYTLRTVSVIAGRRSGRSSLIHACLSLDRGHQAVLNHRSTLIRTILVHNLYSSVCHPHICVQHAFWKCSITASVQLSCSYESVSLLSASAQHFWPILWFYESSHDHMRISGIWVVILVVAIVRPLLYCHSIKSIQAGTE